MINNPTAEKPSPKEFYKFIEPDAGYAGGFLTVLYRKVRMAILNGSKFWVKIGGKSRISLIWLVIHMVSHQN